MAQLRHLRIFITTAGRFKKKRTLLRKFEGIVNLVAPFHSDVLIAKGELEFAKSDIFLTNRLQWNSNVDLYADSDTEMKLVYTTLSGRRHDLTFPDMPYDRWERGRTDAFSFPIDSDDEINAIRSDQFKIVTLGPDAWLPTCIFVIGRSSAGRYRVLVPRVTWPVEAWFSSNVSDVDGLAEKARLLDRTGTPTTS